MRRKTMLNMYDELKEAGSTSDFPLLLANTMHKVLSSKFRGVNSPWRQYTIQGDLNDFRTADRVIMDEAPDLLLVEEEGPYEGSELGENRYQIQLQTYGRTFCVGRNAIINDDLNVLRRQPERFGRSSGRTLAKKIVDQIEGDGNTYDGKNMFHADHNNSGNTTLANSAAGIAAVSAAMTAIEKSTDETGEKMGLVARFLLVPPDNEDVSMRITQGQSFIPVTTTGGTQEVGKATRLTVLVEPFFTSTTSWYVLSDAAAAPAVEVGFLNGKETPDLLMKRADAVSVAGGEDEWGYEFDDIFFKVRHDWGLARGYYQGIFRGKA